MVKNVREVKQFCCQNHISLPYSSQRSRSRRTRREHTHPGCQLKFLLTNKTRLVSIHSCERECLEGPSCTHGVPSPVHRAAPPTEWKSNVTWPLACIAVMIKRSAGNTIHPQFRPLNMLLENAEKLHTPTWKC